MHRAGLAAVIVTLSACSLTPPEDSPRVAYREAESVKSLLVPPDLTRPQSAGAVELGAPSVTGDEILPEFENIRMVRAGPLQWLEVIDAAPRDLWPRMSGFLRNEGLTIGTERRAEGLIETNWAERFDRVPRSGLGGLVQGLFGGVGSDTMRDKYQIRLERIEADGGTRIFLTHWGATEANTNPNSRDTPIVDVVRAEVDPAVAAEMRRRLLVYLGMTRERATRIVAGESANFVYEAPIRLVTTAGGRAYAVFAESNRRRAFGLVGEGLRLIGAEVTETDERKGNIWIRWLPPRELRGGGLFSGDRPRRLLVKLKADDEGVRIRAGDETGTLRSGDLQVALLERLVDVLGGDTTSFRGIEQDEEAGAGPDPNLPQGPQ